MFCSYRFNRRKVAPEPKKADDALAFTMDFTKHKLPDGSYELVIYEVQHILASFLLPLYSSCETIKYKQKKMFFERLIGNVPFRIDHYHGRPVTNAKIGKEIFSPAPNWEGFNRKFIQRMYFNVNQSLQSYIPVTAVITEKDLRNEQAMSRLLDTLCHKPFVIKVDLTENGEGNAFFPGFKSPEALKCALLEHIDNVPDAGATYILIEALAVAEKNPDKAHNDIYRCACVHSSKLDLFNAQIITNHQVNAYFPPDSHLQLPYRWTYYFGGSNTHLRTSESVKNVTLESIVRKRERNLDLKKHKPTLFAQLKEIADEIAKISPEHVQHYLHVRDVYKSAHHQEKLTFGKIIFVSTETRDGAFSEAHLLMNKLTPGKDNKKIRPSMGRRMTL